MKDRLQAFADATFAVALAVSPLSFEDINKRMDCDYDEGIPYTTQNLPANKTLEEVCPPLERAPGQLFGAFYYGHREPAMIISEGNIADGFLPVNEATYGEEDVKLIYEQLEKLKFAHIDYIAMSWHSIGDVRDKFMKFFLEVMKRPDNPYKELRVSEIFEDESNKYSIPYEVLNTTMQYQRDNFLNDPHFLKDENGIAIIYVYAQSMEGILDNPGYAQQWYETGVEYGFIPVLEAYPLYTMNPYYDKLRWFNYAAGNIWEIFPPSTNRTKDRFRITEEYRKEPKGTQQGDIKRLDFDPDRFAEDTEEGVKSGLTVDFTAWNEHFEFADIEFNPVALEIMHDIIPERPTTSRQAVSADQYIEMVIGERNKVVKIQIPPAPVPARSKEYPVYALEARKRKEDEELRKPILKPKFRRKTKAA